MVFKQKLEYFTKQIHISENEYCKTSRKMWRIRLLRDKYSIVSSLSLSLSPVFNAYDQMIWIIYMHQMFLKQTQ